MDFRERILAVLNGEEPDRVPVMGLVMDPATVNQILGKPPLDFVGILKAPGPKEPLAQVLNDGGAFHQSMLDNFSDALESAARLGFDANWVIYSMMRLEKDAQAELGWVWHDPFGRVWELGSDEDGNTLVNYARGLCPTVELWEGWVERNGPRFDTLVENTRTFHATLMDRFRERIFPMGYAAPGIFENCWQPMGFVEFTKLIYRNPDAVRRMVAFHTDLYLRCIDAVMDAGAEVVLGGDDLGQKTGPLMSPALVEKFFGESYRRVAARVHERGRKLVWHSCGNIYALLDKFVEWGFDGIITIEPTAGMGLGKVREQVGHKLVLIGNLDVSRLMVRGTREEIEAAVKQAIAEAGPGGGYILSTCHSHSKVDPTRLEWMIEAAHRYGRYPLS